MTTETLQEPDSPQQVPLNIIDVTPRESAPSAMKDDEPTIARFICAASLMLFAMGTMIVVLNWFMGPRIVPTFVGYIAMFVGLLGMLYHASRDSDTQVRRLYASFGLLLISLASLTAFLSGSTPGALTKTPGFYFVPYGVLGLLVGLMFLMTFLRHETDSGWRNKVLGTELSVGGTLAIAAFLVSIFKPDFLLGSGLLLGVLGLVFLCVYIGQRGGSSDAGYQVGAIIGLLGVVGFLYAFGRSIVPALAVPETAGLLFRIGGVLLVLGGVGYFLTGSTTPTNTGSNVGRAVSIGIGALAIAVFILGGMGSAKVFVGTSLQPFFVPYGLIMMVMGALYAVVGLGICSDNQLVVLTRKELSGYFYSPIAYLVLFGLSMAGWANYLMFLQLLARVNQMGEPRPLPEPIVQFYIMTLVPVLAVIFSVPAVTMRLFSEEHRAGTMEVLCTAPVSESTIVFSKFFASWVFFILLWVPWGLFLIALKLENGVSFDYRPLISFMLVLAASGAGFISMGVFFSSLTRNQIVAAVLTFCGVIVLSMFSMIQGLTDIGETWRAILKHLSYLDLWETSLAGRITVLDLFIQMSFTFFWLYLTVKVLEARRWK